jgi:hypothetical protein
VEGTVYVVTSGSYSGHRIKCVFSDKAVADEYARVHNQHGGDDFGVEEYVLDSAIPRTEVKYCVTIDANGDEIRRYTGMKVEPTPERLADEWYAYDLGTRREFYGGSFRGYDVALNIARDKLAEYKAQQAGVRHASR